MTDPKKPKRILVLCTGNRCRSQMVHGWLKHLGGADVEVVSAGTDPQGVHPLAVKAMAEAGVDIADHTSDHVDQYADQDFDCVITVCDQAKEACPALPGAQQTLHHAFDDPDDKTADPSDPTQLPTFRRVRDEIRDWCQTLLTTQWSRGIAPN